MKWILISVFILINILAKGQNTSSLYLSDTVQISGVLIYDIKSGNNYLKIKDSSDSVKSLMSLKITILLNDYRFMEPNDVIALNRRINKDKLSFCENENRTKYIIDEQRMFKSRYYIIPVDNEYFVKLIYKGREYVTLKCW